MAKREMTLKEKLAKVGLNSATYHSRRQKGMSMEEALSTPSRKAKTYRNRSTGEVMTAAEWAERLGMTPHAFYARIRTYGATKKAFEEKGIGHQNRPGKGKWG